MSISPATRQAFQTLHNVQPQQLEATLQRAVNNDASAWSELQQKTGISDAGQIAQAIDLYRSNSFEGLLGSNYQAATQSVTGGNSPSTFSPTQGGVPASRMDQMIAMRSGGGTSSLSRLGSELASLSTEKKSLEGELATLTTKKGTLETELSGLSLNRRERWFGGALAGILGGDKDKATRGKKLRVEIENTDGAIAGKKQEVRSKAQEMTKTTVAHLRSSGDAQFKTFDTQFQKTSNVMVASRRMLSSISDAQSKVSSAIFQEQMEANSERSQSQQPQNQGFPSTMSSSNWMSDNANREATQALRQVGAQLDAFKDAMRDYGRGVSMAGLSTTSTGNEYDQITDMLSGNMGGNLGGILGGMGSALVISNLHNADSELDALETSVRSIRRSLSSDHDVAQSARTGYIDDVQQRALAMVQ